jgi:hypothetical protein
MELAVKTVQMVHLLCDIVYSWHCTAYMIILNDIYISLYTAIMYVGLYTWDTGSRF